MPSSLHHVKEGMNTPPVTKGAQQEAVDLVAAYIKQLEEEIKTLKSRKTLQQYEEYLREHGHISDANHAAAFSAGMLK